MSESLRIPLRVVFYKEDGSWIAHCLEFDLIGDGDTQEEAIERLAEAIFLQLEASVEHENPANLFSPADGKILRMFAAGKDCCAHGELVFTKIERANVRFSSAEYREYVGVEPACV